MVSLNTAQKRLDKLEQEVSLSDDGPRYAGIQYIIVSPDGTKTKGPYRAIER